MQQLHQRCTRLPLCPPHLFGGSRRAILDIWCFIYKALKPHLPDGLHASIQIGSWYNFQEYFGLRSATLQKATKSARTFFVCCFCNEAWDTLLAAANKTGPINIHGCLLTITEFPPENWKHAIIAQMAQHSKDLQDLHTVHTDRLRLIDPKDKHTLLLLTPSLKLISPKFVDHLPSLVCHTMFFLPSPTTLAFTNHTLHKANIPPHLLAPAP